MLQYLAIVYTISDKFHNVMEIKPDRLSVYTAIKKFYLVHSWTLCPMYRIGFHNDIFLVWTLNGVTSVKFDFI